MQLLEMVESNELNRSLLTILDENIASAHQGNQVIALGKVLPVSPDSFSRDFICLFEFEAEKLQNLSQNTPYSSEHDIIY